MQRNGQNPIKSSGVFEKTSATAGNLPVGQSHGAGGGLLCPACKTPVPPKPGFRPSALKCPKCGAAAVKK